MAKAGQLKAKIDILKKKIADRGPSLTAGRRRYLKKRLRRLQRSRRIAVRLDQKAHGAAKGEPAGGAEGTTPSA
ncbi:MAG TPA: hypothetical protein VNL37_04360 [Candidatus Polarisedimenticolia bacterium]|nr:hypothetical protein [Candidatus Polarisedimenticolia bacterium]